jgi:hypothetical protein
MSNSSDDGWDEEEEQVISDDDSSYRSSNDEEEDDDDASNRSLLWLCQEGMISAALERVKRWDRDHPPGSEMEEASVATAAIRRELFQKNADGHYALHEVLMGGTHPSAAALVERLVDRLQADYPEQSKAIFTARPGQHGRTLLHWCAWGKAHVSVLRKILRAEPECLCMRDDAGHTGRPRTNRRRTFENGRTPLDLARRYWPDTEITAILERATADYVPHRVRRAVLLSATRHFVTDRRTPFDKLDRKEAGLTPRPWFVASCLGYALQLATGDETSGVAHCFLSREGGENRWTEEKEEDR